MLMSNSINRVYCLETRISNKDAEYFKQYIPEFDQLCRRIWQDLKHGVKTDSKYVTELCHRYGFMKRTINSALHQMKGRANALRRLSKTQIYEKKAKVKALESKIEDITLDINLMKGQVAKNPNNKDLIQRYKNKKKRRYGWQQRKIRFENSIKQFENDPLVYYNLCFGSKHEFRKQYNLDKNGYKTHEKWYNDFCRLRDRQAYYLGSSDEKCGNQQCQLTYNEETDRFMLKVRKENKWCDESLGKSANYVWLDIDFKYRRDMLIQALEDNKALTYTITRKGRKWYIDVAINQECEIVTDESNGCVGLDYNNGFIALTETDNYGNIVHTETIRLYNHGTGGKAKAELSEKISKIVRYARDRNKAISIENLEFRKTKSQQMKKGKRAYNKMLHLLDYGRYKQLCIDYSATYGVKLILVNPAYTSKIGKQKYMKPLKLSVHKAAAYVIARRGQGYTDEYIENVA